MAITTSSSSSSWWLVIRFCSHIHNWSCKNALPCLSVHPSTCPQCKTQEWLNGFSWNLILVSFTKICQHIPILVKRG
jgi:hypothetical protein